MTTSTAATFDADAVRSLTGHPDDAAFAVVFVSRYRGMLPERVRRIASAVRGDDLETALDAVLSLKVASATVGTRELCELGGRIESLLRSGDWGAAIAEAGRLPDAARRADRALGAFLGC